MALSVSRARVKEKCGIANADFDDTIDNLILEITPVVEQLIRADALDDPAVGVQSTLTLAATEIVTAEFLLQIARAPGAAETICMGNLRLEPNIEPARRMLASGYDRLVPYLQPTTYATRTTRVGVGTGEEGHAL